MLEIENLKQEIIEFFESDKSFIKENMNILDDILANVYNLHR